jgi:flagellar L-ring protein FlgH
MTTSLRHPIRVGKPTSSSLGRVGNELASFRGGARRQDDEAFTNPTNPSPKPRSSASTLSRETVELLHFFALLALLTVAAKHLLAQQVAIANDIFRVLQQSPREGEVPAVLSVIGRRLLALGLMVFFIISISAPVRAQQTSLFHQEPGGRSTLHMPQAPLVEIPGMGQRVNGLMEQARDDRAVGLAAASWTYTPPLPRKVFRLQDIVTIRVDELARMRAEGRAEARRNLFYDALLKDWISLADWRLRPDQQAAGDPRINGQSNQQFRADASVESRESLAFSIAARVVDIQPNGNLVLEANKTVRFNDNLFETSLTGICRAQDIAPDNVILSRDLLDLEIKKNETGHLRDSYKRGWLTRWIGELNPF